MRLRRIRCGTFDVNLHTHLWLQWCLIVVVDESVVMEVAVTVDRPDLRLESAGTFGLISATRSILLRTGCLLLLSWLPLVILLLLSNDTIVTLIAVWNPCGNFWVYCTLQRVVRMQPSDALDLRTRTFFVYLTARAHTHAHAPEMPEAALLCA
jgi:hypothetical protein